MANTLTLELNDQFTLRTLDDVLWALSPEYHGKVQCWTMALYGTVEEPTRVDFSVLHVGDPIPSLAEGVATIHIHLQFEAFCKSMRTFLAPYAWVQAVQR